MRCPHLVYQNVLGTETVSAMLEYVALHEHDFAPATVWSRKVHQQRIDLHLRHCTTLSDVGVFETSLRNFLHGVMAPSLCKLGLLESAVEPREFEICAYGTGSHFPPHIDTTERSD